MSKIPLEWKLLKAWVFTLFTTPGSYLLQFRHSAAAAAVAAVKLLQSCLTLSRPWDSPGKNTGVGCHSLLQCMKVKSESEVTQSCPTLSDPMDCSPPGSSLHGIFRARVLEWVTIAFSTQSCPSLWDPMNCSPGYCKVRLSLLLNMKFFLKHKTQKSLFTYLYLLMNLQCCVNFWWTAQWINFIHFFQNFFLIYYFKMLNVVPCAIE